MKIYHQNTFEKWQIRSNSVQTLITSPPYWSQRKYDIPDIKIKNWAGQYGLEKSYKLYIKHTLLWLKKAWRVLKNNGILWFNIGDTYNTSGTLANKKHYNLNKTFCLRGRSKELPIKSLMMIPERIVIGMIDAGWILRNKIIWYKLNAMPESAKDRFSKKWEYVYMFSKQKKYYFNVDAIKIPFKNNALLNKNPGDIWEINTQSSSYGHHAISPAKLVKRMILCSTNINDVILDPFCGSGTTLKVAEELNRESVGIDLGYKELQNDRLNNIQKSLIN